MINDAPVEIGQIGTQGRPTISKALMKAEQGGAVAVWSSSGMTDPDDQVSMNRELYRLLFGRIAQAMTIGEVTARAKASIANEDIRRTWILLGDPTSRLR